LSDEWYKLDNVSKVFLATYNKRDTRSIRVSCTLKEPVDSKILKQALNETVKLRPQFQVRIRRGFFWHYIERTDREAIVCEEDDRPCPQMYGPDYKGVLHYKVSYYLNRINIDMFHAISDGTGALIFLKLLVFNYLKLAHKGQLEGVVLGEGATDDERYQNSYSHFYENTSSVVPGKILNKKKKAYHIQSRKLPYNQLQFFEVHLPADKLLKSSKAINVSLTSYLGAKLMLAIYSTMPLGLKKKPVTISLPVNLRNYYPSETMRNFFNNVDVSHVFDGSETVESLAQLFDENLKDSIKPENIKKQMNRYQKIERLAVTRVVPLLVKQPVVRAFAKKESKTVTAVLSNLGSMNVPDKMQEYIKGFTDFCSTDKLFITVTSYGNDMVLGIASAYQGTGVVKRFIEAIRTDDMDIKLYATEVVR